MSLLDLIMVTGTVEEVEQVAPRVRRIAISGVPGLPWRPGQHVRVLVTDLMALRTWLSGFKDVLRTYSVWDYDPRGRLDLCVLDHPQAGPGALWARTASIGQQVAFTRPEGRLLPRDEAPYHLFAGDETAAPAFGAMLRALPPAARVFGAVATAGLPLPRAGELAAVETTPEAGGLAGRVRELELPERPGVAYVAGEARDCQAVRHHLMRERGWPRDAIKVKAFWAPGKRGLD
ncbi:siderophore-interacting protein [Nonomuraea sp. NN258]|uniref:siderophore-interacting protein n=1 Tax=Nonomuraea antri TaxID=2730852 RepID=UPI001569A52F|nr:siderophore-interacting protein [Nonomuraea antri]NRQ40893.1 siderophore-interacting protein [Nonomuraea antri]